MFVYRKEFAKFIWYPFVEFAEVSVQDEGGDAEAAQVEVTPMEQVDEVIMEFEDEFDLRDEDSWVSSLNLQCFYSDFRNGCSAEWLICQYTKKK